MAKPKSNGYGEGTFVKSRIFLSPAFLSLGHRGTAPSVSDCSAQVLMLFLGERQFGYLKNKKGQKNLQRTDGNLFTLTYKELEGWGISQKRTTRAIDELLCKGFISIVDPGGAFEKHKAVYALEEDFLRWRPGDDPIRVRERDVLRGYQGNYKIKTTDASDGHPHGRQRRTPHKKTRTPTGDTQKNEVFADAHE